MSTAKSDVNDLEARLCALQAECRHVQGQIDKLRAAESASDGKSRRLGTPVLTKTPESPSEKIDLFLRLFRCRESVYARFWENPKKGIKGYAPACLNEWKPGICNKPKIKCSECANQAFPKLEAGPKPPYHIFAYLLTTHARRNSLIVTDAMTALKQGRLPLILSDRKDHLSRLAAAVDETAKLDQAFEDLAIFHMDGAMGLKARREMLATIRSRVATGRQTLILSTASLIGEGFDLPELDVLVMASPFSFKGRIVQYAGRIHRAAGGKSQATIHDYVEVYCQTSLKMYRNRVKAYREMSYAITELDSRSPAATESTPTSSSNS